MDPILKKIKIQTGVLKRISVEKVMYQKEATSIEKQIEDMKASGKDEYDIKKRTECLEESRMMVPDCEKRLKTAMEAMTNLLTVHKDDCSDEEIYKNAQLVLTEVKSG